jgi:hypothetical protein
LIIIFLKCFLNVGRNRVVVEKNGIVIMSGAVTMSIIMISPNADPDGMQQQQEESPLSWGILTTEQSRM